MKNKTLKTLAIIGGVLIVGGIVIKIKRSYDKSNNGFAPEPIGTKPKTPKKDVWSVFSDVFGGIIKTDNPVVIN